MGEPTPAASTVGLPICTPACFEECPAPLADRHDGLDVADSILFLVLPHKAGELGIEGLAAGSVGGRIVAVAADIPDREGEEAREALAACVGHLAEQLEADHGVEQNLDAERIGEGGSASLEQGAGRAAGFAGCDATLPCVLAALPGEPGVVIDADVRADLWASATRMAVPGGGCAEGRRGARTFFDMLNVWIGMFGRDAGMFRGMFGPRAAGRSGGVEVFAECVRGLGHGDASRWEFAGHGRM